ncbi:MAG: DUF2927 domain-containing protein [Pseudomonadota bacterium]
MAVIGLCLTACAQRIPDGPADPYTLGAQPPAPVLGAALPAGGTTYSNGSLARLFVRLTHDLEWGASRPHLVRYEGPVRVQMRGRGRQGYRQFLDDFLGQLRQRAGVQISRAPGNANLVIRFVPGNDYKRAVPQHFCLVAPGLISWERFRQDPVRFGTRPYETQRTMEGMTVFLPDNAEPYLVRHCLIEEITQALGPVNDLYGLGPSIFNDDAAHIWPTQLDYLMLRVLYAPEIRSGLDRSQTYARALTVLNRENPAGRSAPALPRLLGAGMDRWRAEVRLAFDRTRSLSRRIRHAKQAVQIAARRAPQSAYHCRALVTLARLARTELDTALSAANTAGRVCRRAHGPGDIRMARLALDRARVLYEAKDYTNALAAVEGAETVLAAHGQDERLMALYALRAGAYRAIQQGTRSLEERRKAGAWGAYALGRNHPNVRRWQVE